MARRPLSIVLGALLCAAGVAVIAAARSAGGAVPMIIGAALVYTGSRPGRTATILLGHACIAAGCALTAWGLYLLPHSSPTWQHVLLRPLFWGLFSIFGGVCAIFHGFCGCVRRGSCGGGT